MELRLIVVAVFFCSVCGFSEAQLVTPLNSSITATSCGLSKLCMTVDGCDPAGKSECFFSSTQFTNPVLTVEISGSTLGYVALGLTPTGSPSQQLLPEGAVVFVCGNNINTAFFETATQNGPVLTPATVNALNITTVQASVTSTKSLIQCTFNITLNSTLLSNPVKLPFNITILTGGTKGTALGNATTIFQSNGPLDLADSMSNIPTPVPLSITRDGCGISKLCLANPSGCDPAGNSECFFNSIRKVNDAFFFELSGTTRGYVALGLGKQGSTIVFVCGTNTVNMAFFFETAAQLSTQLLLANVGTVYSSQGAVQQNPNRIQCLFNTSTSLQISSLRIEDPLFTVSIINGTTSGRTLGPVNTVFNSNTSLNLSDPTINAPAPLKLNITRTGCNTTKICLSQPSDCDPAGNSNCFFGSLKISNSNNYYEVSGTTTGYVALGFAKQGSTVVFVCGSNSKNKTFFFETTAQFGTTLIPINVSTVFYSQGVVGQNPNRIQCLFNTSTSLNINGLKVDDTSFTLSILNGTTNETQLGPAEVLVDFKVLNQSNPTSTVNRSNFIISHWTHVLAVLLGVLTLRLL